MALLRTPLLDLSSHCSVPGQSCHSHGKRSDPSRFPLSSRFHFGFLRDNFMPDQAPLLQLHTKPPYTITAVIKRRKDFTLDSVIQRQKKLKLVSKIKELLVRQPGMVMSLKHLGKFRKELGLTGKRRVVALLRKYPGVFEVFEEGIHALYFRFTPEAEDQIFEEQELRGQLENALVTKIRKMLMMSVDKTLLLSKLDHLKKDLGLPNDYRVCMADKYPQFFKIIETEAGLALELTSWDPELAISAWEKKLQSGPLPDDNISGRPRRFTKIDLPRGHSLKRKDIEVLRKFQAVPFVSPYSDFSQIHPASKEAEKHSCAVVHEILTLTLEKRTLIDHLTHFRKDYKFSQQLHGMLIRHPELFYVSLKGDRDSIFLREAYDGSQLIEKDPLVIAKEKLGRLVAIGNQKKQRIADDEEFDDDSGDFYGEDGWSDDEDENDVNAAEKEQLERLQRHRELRRPLHIVEREKALVSQVVVPRERW